jgi:hypothetical protein
MSSSIVVALRVFGAVGTEAALVMAQALALIAAAIGSPVLRAARPQAAVSVDAEPTSGGGRLSALAALLGLWRRSSRSRARPDAEPAREAGWVDEPVGVPVIGYATFSRRAGGESDEELAKQAEVIARACERRGLLLLEVVREPHSGPAPERAGMCSPRPGLRYALGRIAAGEARGLVVPGLRRLTRSTAELGPIVEWFTRRRVRLVAVAQGLDTGEREGRFAARLLVEISRWERERVGDPTSPPGSHAEDVCGDLLEDLTTEEGSS